MNVDMHTQHRPPCTGCNGDYPKRPRELCHKCQVAEEEGTMKGHCASCGEEFFLFQSRCSGGTCEPTNETQQAGNAQTDSQAEWKAEIAKASMKRRFQQYKNNHEKTIRNLDLHGRKIPPFGVEKAKPVKQIKKSTPRMIVQPLFEVSNTHTTYYLLPAACCLVPTTYSTNYLPPTTYYLLPTTYYLQVNGGDLRSCAISVNCVVDPQWTMVRAY
jgi:hypothetical protein